MIACAARSRISRLLLLPLLVALCVIAVGCSTQMLMKLAPVNPHYMKIIDEMPTGKDLDQWVYIPGITLPKGKVIYDCGPETLTAVFTFWGKETSIEEVAKETYRIKDKGTLSIDLMLFARRKGMSAEIRKGEVLSLEKSILKGIPPIIMLDVATYPIYHFNFADPKSKFHFLVVTGYNERTREIMCELYDGQKVLIHWQFLRKAWAKGGFYQLEVAPPERFEDLK